MGISSLQSRCEWKNACEGEEKAVEGEKAHISYFLRKLWSSSFLLGTFDRSQDSLSG